MASRSLGTAGRVDSNLNLRLFRESASGVWQVWDLSTSLTEAKESINVEMSVPALPGMHRCFPGSSKRVWCGGGGATESPPVLIPPQGSNWAPAWAPTWAWGEDPFLASRQREAAPLNCQFRHRRGTKATLWYYIHAENDAAGQRF